MTGTTGKCVSGPEEWIGTEIFLMSLRDWVERAEAHPHPYDVKIHVGD